MPSIRIGWSEQAHKPYPDFPFFPRRSAEAGRTIRRENSAPPNGSLLFGLLVFLSLISASAGLGLASLVRSGQSAYPHSRSRRKGPAARAQRRGDAPSGHRGGSAGRLQTWRSPSGRRPDDCRLQIAEWHCNLHSPRSAGIDHFTARPCGHGRKNRVGVIAQESDRAVPHQEVAPT